MVDIAKLAETEVQDPGGNKVRLGRYWQDQTVVLVFIRHFG